MSWLTTAANAAWCASGFPAYVSFRSVLSDPRRTQLQLLRDYVRKNAATEFSREHGFEQIDDLASFRRRVPARGYDEMTPWIDRIVAGRHRVLTADRVTRLIPSSGSTRAAKLIPYTAWLQREFNRAISPWIIDLYRESPDLMRGCAYWSISPVTSNPEQRLKSAVPIGFDEDSAYLGGVRKRLVDAVMAVPADVRRLTDVAEFQFATLFHLLARRDLRLISVWHPSFLDLLLDAARDRWSELLERIREVDPNRASQLRDAGCENWSAIWPHLRVVSCWADANAEGPAVALRRRLPHVKLQAKGLLATEAFVSIPFAGRWPLAVCSHFFEFEDERGDFRSADELKPGGTYDVVVTTAGGLWRYRLGDRVRCDGLLGRTPSVRFVGRSDLVVDNFGEKLSEGFAGEAIRRVLATAQVEADFAMLAPDRRKDERGCYTLFIAATGPGINPPAALVAALDEALKSNPHYAYCRDLGQLARPRIFGIRRGAYDTYVAAARESGKRMGDVKPVALDGRHDWCRRFDGSYVGDDAI